MRNFAKSGFVVLMLLTCAAACETRQEAAPAKTAPAQTAAPDRNPDLFNQVMISDFEPVTPPSASAAEPVKPRGDAACSTGGTIVRGASAGLVFLNEADGGTDELSTVFLPGAVTDVICDGSMLYAASGPAGVFIVDASDAKKPRVLKRIDTPGGAYRLDLEKDTLVIADGTLGVVVMDVSKPRAPQTLAMWRPEKGYVRHAIIHANTIYVANGRQGIAVLEFEGKGILRLTGQFDTPGIVRALYLENDRIIVADGPAGLAVFERKGVSQLNETGRMKFRDMVRDVAALKDRAFVANSDDGLVVVDIRDPAAMKQTALVEYDKPVNRVVLDGKRLLLGNDADGLSVVDITDPDKPISGGE